MDTGGKKATTVVHYDDQHRERKRQTTDDDGSLGLEVDTVYRHGTGASYKLVSNPYRATDTNATRGWTLTTPDNMGRVSSVDTFGGSAMPSLPSSSGSLGKTTWAYANNTTTVTEDDNGSSLKPARTTVADALGRLTSASDGASTASYSYDALGNLGTVTQGVQTRTFHYL